MVIHQQELSLEGHAAPGKPWPWQTRRAMGPPLWCTHGSTGTNPWVQPYASQGESRREEQCTPCAGGQAQQGLYTGHLQQWSP